MYKRQAYILEGTQRLFNIKSYKLKVHSEVMNLDGCLLYTSGPARAVIELAGIKNIRTKCMGSRNKQNVVLATIAGLSQLKTPEEVAKLRGKSVEEIFA